MNTIKWLTSVEVEYAHTIALRKDGGAEGFHDKSLLESALANPQNLYAYSGETDTFHLAASYAESIARNHAFKDGNKRTGLASAMMFLEKNNQSLKPSKSYPDYMVNLTKGAINRQDFATFLKENSIHKSQNKGEAHKHPNQVEDAIKKGQSLKKSKTEKQRDH